MDRGSYNRPTAAALMIFLLWRLPGQGASPCPQAIFSFGDSLTDTGNAISNKPFTHSTQRALQAPYGSTYFGRPSNRFSDGRLLVDFIAKAFGYPFLAPYLGGAGADYRRGANFAYCGAEGRDGSNLAVNDLPVQVKQFQYLKTNVLAKFSESEGAEGLERLLLPSPDDFSTALYYIFIGINDFFHGYTQHQAMTPSEQNETVVPYLISSVSDAIQSLYGSGARTFVIVNVPPLGCIPDMLGIALSRNIRDYRDSFGCWGSVNSVIQNYNRLLLQQIQAIMRNTTSFAGTIEAFDAYQVYYDVVQNAEKNDLGFDRGIILQPCITTKNTCSNPSAYISWDGIHFTDAFNKHMARTFLTGFAAESCLDDLGRL